MSDGLDPDDYEITIGSPTPKQVDEPDGITDGVEISDERYQSLRAHISSEYHGEEALCFAMRDINRLGPDRYVVSFHRQDGGGGMFQNEFIAIAAWDDGWELPEVERVLHTSWH